MSESAKVTIPFIRSLKGRRRISMVTAYDAPAGRSVDAAGIDMILVGDSLGMVVLGHDTTLPVTMDNMAHHVAAVRRSVSRALLVADMPFLSFSVSPRDTVLNAGRLVKEGGAEAVKVEGGRKRSEAIRALLDAEIPVMGHLGLTPQSVHGLGGYKVQGKEPAVAEALKEEALLLQELGVFSIVLEGVPDSLAACITGTLSIPTIGIGAGPSCDGQVLVFHDLLGWSGGTLPRFVRTYVNLEEVIGDGLRRFREDVEAGTFPGEKESYGG